MTCTKLHWSCVTVLSWKPNFLKGIFIETSSENVLSFVKRETDFVYSTELFKGLVLDSERHIAS